LHSEVASPAATAGSGGSRSAGARGDSRLASRYQRWWWQIAVLAALVSLVAGGSIQHAVDQGRAARDLYRIQVLTTVSQFLAEEGRQIALPVARRNVGAFGDLADSIDTDLGVNGSGTLQVTVGTGSVAPFTQIAMSATVTSPYAATTFAVWVVRGAGAGGMADQNVGACVLSSTLLGPGRATTNLPLGASGLAACSRTLWSPGSTDPMLPHLAWAQIPTGG
jgi:hypothetical protein